MCTFKAFIFVALNFTMAHGKIPDQGDALRAFLADIVDFADPKIASPERTQKLISIFKQHTPILATLMTEGWNQPIEEAHLYLPHQKISKLLPVGRIQKVLQVVQNSASPMKTISKFPLHFLPHQTINSLVFITKNILLNTPLMDQVIMGEVDALTREINLAIADFDVQDSGLMVQIFSPATGFDLGKIPASLRPQLVEFVRNFYNDMDLTRKRKIIDGYFRLPAQSSLAQIIGQIISDSGPIIIKLSQLFREYSPPHISFALRSILDNLPPTMNTEDIKNLLQELHLEKSGYKLLSFSRRPIAVASVGQVHTGTLVSLRHPKIKKQIIIKVIKPNLASEIQSDFEQITNQLSSIESLQPLLSSLRLNLMEEIDLRKEVEKFSIGTQVYNNTSSHIQAVGALTGVLPHSHIMLQERAPGKSLVRFEGQDQKFLRMKAKALRELLELWFSNAIFGNGFIHADLHAGNLFFDPVDSKNFKLSLIDFGSTAILTKEERLEIIHLGAGLFFDDRQATCSAIQNLVLLGRENQAFTQVENVAFQNFCGELKRKSKKMYRSMYHQLTDIISRALDLGIVFSPNFVQFNRGRIFLEEQLTKTILRLNPQEQDSTSFVLDAYISATLKYIPKVIPHQVWNDGARIRMPLPKLFVVSLQNFSGFISAGYQEGFAGLRTNSLPLRTNIHHMMRALGQTRQL